MRHAIFRPVFALLRRRSRHRRYRQIQALMDVESLPDLLLDLGGGAASFFAATFPRPRQVILVEMDPTKAQHARQRCPDLSVVVADGERLPLADRSVAATICNSVIEHVADPSALAVEIRRVSRSYFLQTPHGGFPLDFHSFIPIPFYNLIPGAKLRRLTCRLFGAHFEYLSSVRYLSESRLKQLFPEASIAYERVGGLKKSFYVYYLAAYEDRAPRHPGHPGQL